jgi:hypothetical protein
MGVVNKQPDADNFQIIGSTEPEDDYVATTGLEKNEVTMDTYGDVGGFGAKPISINSYNVQIILENGQLVFYQQPV